MDNARTFLTRGAIAGAAGGAAAAIFQWLVTERPIRWALRIEEAASTSTEEPMFSRGTQVLGGMLGAALFGLFLGVVFGVVAASQWHRLPGDGPFGRASRLATAAFVGLTLVPFLKYPGNPPAVGDPDTVNERTLAYGTLLVASVIFVLLAWYLWDHLTRSGIAGARRFALTGLAYGAVLCVSFLVWPANPDPIEVPAKLIWRFRVDSLGQSALMWAVMAVVFGLLCERSARAEAPREVAARRETLSS